MGHRPVGPTRGERSRLGEKKPGASNGSGHGTGRNSVTLKQVSEVLSMGSAWKTLELCRLGVHMHGPSWSGWSGSAVGCPGSPHSDSVFYSVFRSNTSTDQTNRDQTRFGWRRGVVHLHPPLPARSRQAGATVRRRRPFAADEPRHLQRHREHLAAEDTHATGTASAATMQHSAAIFQHGCAIIALQI